MKKLIIIFVLLVAFSVEAQSKKTMTDKVKVESVSTSQSTFLDQFANVQVKKFTKILKLSEQQQSQVSDLVMTQLKSPKFQKLIGSMSSEKLSSGAANKDFSVALENDTDFKNSMNVILTEDQKVKMKKTKKTKM